MEEQFHVNKLFYDEYYVYNADSAMAYVDKNLNIAFVLNRKDWEYAWKINKSFLLTTTGLLKEAEEILREIRTGELSDDLKTNYYIQMYSLWEHFGEFTRSHHDRELRRGYWNKEHLYLDSVYQVIKPSHPLFLCYQGTYRLAQGTDNLNYVTAELSRSLERLSPDTRNYAMNAYILSSIYRKVGDMDNFMKYLAYSAIADVSISNKETYSLEELGEYLFTLGDIDRSYAYMNSCLQDALNNKNRVRILGISNTIDQINAVYQERVRLQGRRIQIYSIVVSVLFLVLLFSFIYISKKLRQLAVSRAELHDMNGKLSHHVNSLSEAQSQLKEANEKLLELNDELKNVNAELRESNYVKEEYIGYVFSLCSNYISKLDEYRKNINRKMKTNQLDEVLAMTSRPTMAQNELKDFYRNFDAIFCMCIRIS